MAEDALVGVQAKKEPSSPSSSSSTEKKQSSLNSSKSSSSLKKSLKSVKSQPIVKFNKILEHDLRSSKSVGSKMSGSDEERKVGSTVSKGGQSPNHSSLSPRKRSSLSEDKRKTPHESSLPAFSSLLEPLDPLENQVLLHNAKIE